MKLFLIRGISGSGKTFLANKMKKEINDSVIVESDNFFELEDGYNFDYKYISDAHNYCLSLVAFHLFRKRTVIVSNTSINYEHIKIYYELSLRYDSEFEIINLEEKYKNTHNVPEKDLNSMRSRFVPLTTNEFINLYTRIESEISKKIKERKWI